jgi:SPP1 gp7 family putative phage head morphogenesis protein
VLIAELTAAALGALGDVADAVGPSFDPAQMATAAGAWARGYSYELVAGLTDTTRGAVAQAVAAFSEGGLSSAQVAQMLAPAFGARRADVIAVTEIGRASAQAQRVYGEYLTAAGLPVEYVYNTVNEDRVCPICAPRNGQIVEPTEFPPLHPRCRCFVTVRVKGVRR